MDRTTVLHAFDYSPKTGVFTWRNPQSRRVKAGDVAGTVDTKGYRKIKLGGQRLAAHRLAWLLAYGEWPPGEIDHIDKNKDNNAIDNLRIVTGAHNCQRRHPVRKNKTGFTGVTFVPERKVIKTVRAHYTASIGANGRDISLGRFKTAEEASAAYEAAKLKYHEA